MKNKKNKKNQKNQKINQIKKVKINVSQKKLYQMKLKMKNNNKIFLIPDLIILQQFIRIK